MNTNRSANDEFKKSLESWWGVGLIAAVGLHFALFMLVPQFQAADMGIASEEMRSVELPPEVRIPPPPEQIARPATPRVASVELDEDVTIAPTTFESNPVENLPPPPKTGSPSDRPSFIPYDTPPKLKNLQEIDRLMERAYPRTLKDAGVGGRIVLWIYVTEGGQVEQAVVRESSGHDLLDEAARQVALQMEFNPAKNRDQTTAVWVQQAVTFEVK